MIFHQPFWLYLLILLPIPWFFMRRKGFLHNTTISRLPAARFSLLFGRLPDVLFTVALACMITALAKPMIPDDPTVKNVVGRDIILAVDISLSMVDELKTSFPERETKIPELESPLPPGGLSHKDQNLYHPDMPKNGKMRRIDGAQAAVLNFLRNRYLSASGDRIGMIVFDQRPRIAWPLTHDLRMIYRKGQFVQEGMGGGTNFGARGPGPIDLAVEQFKELGQADSKIVIMVTDGEDEIDWNAMERLQKLIQENGLRLHVIGVGPTLAKNDVAIMRLTRAVGGQVFRAETEDALNKCLAEIDKLERSPIKHESHANEQDFFHFFAGLSLIFLLAATVGELLIVNQ